MLESIRLLTAKLQGAAAQLRYLPRALRLVWAAAHGWSLIWAGLLLAQGLLPVAVVYLTKTLVDNLAAAVGTGADWTDLRPTLILAGMMGALLLLGELMRSATDWVRAAQAKLVEDHVSALIHHKSTSVDLAFYESPDFHDHLHRARDEAGYRPVALLENAGSLAQNGITLLAMAAVLVPYGMWMPAALLLSTLPALVVVLRFAVRQHRWRLHTTPVERRASYYDWLMTAGQTAPELRLFGLGDYFRSTYQALRARLRREHLQMAWSQGLAELAAGAIGLLVAASCLAWMVWRVMLGHASLGDLALFYQAFSQGQRLLRSLLSSMGQIYYNILFLGNLFEFLDLEPKVLEPPQPLAAPVPGTASKGLAICFHEVTFRYPGSERVALQNLSLTIPAGQIAAIVGANGAGKSTLLKLLCRFYDPQAGRIELNGVDLRELSLNALRGLITVLFQEPVHYNATVAENIAVGSSVETMSGAEVEAAARAAGAEGLIARLPNGYEALLGKWFAGGVELSTGEWQRLALARAFLRQAPVIILDEPTSAMDSWAESDWLQRFRSLAADRTAIIVTHRFTTAMQADVIHVMDQGQVVESGHHSELMLRDGRYAQSWRAQMRAGLSASRQC
jgi:ATP-binding cassette subfamily B protein